MKYYSKLLTVYYYGNPDHWIPYQSCTHSAPSQLPGEHSGQAPLQGRTYPTGYPFIHLGGEQQCGWCVLLKDKSARIEPATHWSRVKRSIQYTIAPPHLMVKDVTDYGYPRGRLGCGSSACPCTPCQSGPGVVGYIHVQTLNGQGCYQGCESIREKKV